MNINEKSNMLLNPKSPRFFDVFEISDPGSPTLAVGADLIEMSGDDVDVAIEKFKENSHEIILTHLYRFLNQHKNSNQIAVEVVRLIGLSDKNFYETGM